jgi:hypothetical protein
MAARDFTGDGRPDLLLQNQSNGSARIRQMVGLSMVGEQDLAIAPNSPWTIVGSGNLNADGYPDIVWQNMTAGQVYVWYMKPNGGHAGFAVAAGASNGDYLRDANQQSSRSARRHEASSVRAT